MGGIQEMTDSFSGQAFVVYISDFRAMIFGGFFFVVYIIGSQTGNMRCKAPIMLFRLKVTRSTSFL